MFKGKHGKKVTKFIVNDDIMVNAILLVVDFLRVNLIDSRLSISISLVSHLVCRVFKYFNFLDFSFSVFCHLVYDSGSFL